MPLAADSALTSDRTEHKYRLEGERAGALRALLDEALAPHHHAPAPTVARMAQHYTTTVYFDTATREIYRAAAAARPHTKLRARAYYDLLPLAELATSQDDLLRSSSLLWIELKGRNGLWTGKRRLGLERKPLRAFLADPSRGLSVLGQAAERPELADDLTALARALERLPGPLQPSCIVNYRRSAWQDPSGELRVTLDEDLAFFAVSDLLWDSPRALTRQALGKPDAIHPARVVEVKRRRAFPEWLADALTELGAEPTGQSKFLAASQAVLGPATAATS